MSAQKEHGIIMSGDHPLKVINQTKTQTRRTWGLKEINKNPDAWHLVACFLDGKARFYSIDALSEAEADVTIKCPYGGVGDRLWIRETWRISSWDNEEGQFDIEYRAGGVQHGLCVTEAILNKYWLPNAIWPEDKWRSSMFMPRWASRALLEITEFRALRLHSITAEDAGKEGGYTVESYIQAFLTLNHIKMDTNLWVWTIEFRELEHEDCLIFRKGK